MKAQGIPTNQIIHLNYDDVAGSSQNPYRGQLFNAPTAAGVAGKDVYAGCKIDYKGSQTTAANVVKVLTGDASAPGPVLKSNANSKVFFYFADHGAPGLVAMPTGGYLYADAFHNALKTMHSKGMYKEMVVYIEACESGSMFQNILENNINVYALSAANAVESSWGTYCSPQDSVNGKHIGSCLGDLFSTNWMEDADKAKMGTETLQQQFKTVQAETTKSHVLQWGQLTWTNEPIGDFESGKFGEEPVETEHTWWHDLKNKGKRFIMDQLKENSPAMKDKNDFAVDSRDIKLHQLYQNVKMNPSIENMNELQEELKMRTSVDERFQSLFPHHLEAVKEKTYPLPTDFECLRTLINAYEEHCHKLDDYSLKWVSAFVAECEGMKSFPEGKNQTVTKIQNTCANVE